MQIRKDKSPSCFPIKKNILTVTISMKASFNPASPAIRMQNPVSMIEKPIVAPAKACDKNGLFLCFKADFKVRNMTQYGIKDKNAFKMSLIINTPRKHRDLFNNTDNSALIGIIVGITLNTTAGLGNLMQFLAATKQPVSFLEVTDRFRAYMSPYKNNLLFKFFSASASPVCGFEMGKHLLSTGHRNIAFLSVYSRTMWSRNRYIGLEEAVSKLNASEAKLFNFEAGIAHPNTFLEQFQTSFQTTIDYLKNRTDPAGKNDPNQQRILTKLEEDVLAMTIDFGISFYADILCKKALQNPKITAWVAENDDLAIRCMQYLKTIPPTGRRIAIAGFDDGIKGRVQKLTSYNFKFEALARQMLDHVLHPNPQQHNKFKAFFEEVEGYVIPRETTFNI